MLLFEKKKCKTFPFKYESKKWHVEKRVVFLKKFLSTQFFRKQLKRRHRTTYPLRFFLLRQSTTYGFARVKRSEDFRKHAHVPRRVVRSHWVARLVRLELRLASTVIGL